MTTLVYSQINAKKRPVNLSLNEALVAEVNRQTAANRLAEGWNTVLAKEGSFADEHSTL